MKISEFKVSFAYIMSSRPTKPTLFLEWVRHGGSHLLSQYFGGQCMRPAMSLNLGLYSEFQDSLYQKQKQKNLRLTVFISSASVRCTALNSGPTAPDVKAAAYSCSICHGPFLCFPEHFLFPLAFSSQSQRD